MPSYVLKFLLLMLIISLHHRAAVGGGGSWQLLQKSVGISPMHMQLLDDDQVIMFDRTDFGASKLPLPDNHCRVNPNDLALKNDCTAHSAAYDSVANTFRPLTVLTDTWCSSGVTLADGRLLQSGGWNDGERAIRFMDPGCPACDWAERPNELTTPRWYATNHILPDGRVIIIGGRNAFNYEFYPGPKGPFDFAFLKETNDPKAENNLYPFVNLHMDGNLFIFANNRAILFDYNKNVVVKKYPIIPGGDPRSYPSTGSAVMLPVKGLEEPNPVVEFLVCGGAPAGSFEKALNGQFVPGLNTCARLKITDPNPAWILEIMPMARVMGDMLLLPNGDVLLINGAGAGVAGWELGRDPVLAPVIYHTDNPLGKRFDVQNPTAIPRMYHSTAVLLRDGRVLVAGSNPHQFYEFGANALFPTELSLEAFSPPYLDPVLAGLRPNIVGPPSRTPVKYGAIVPVKFTAVGAINPALIKVTMVRPPFTTHSYSMSHRLLVLTNADPVVPLGKGLYQVNVIMPKTANVAPPGFYMLFVVHQDVPSEDYVYVSTYGREIIMELHPS
ncbi:hypothetical protein Cgig2_026547 [Carnegiea gigantea]|uniref:Galactose oxidase n=1 Tax=Carnegiea gigantea TaxID=171969 RepID=A0A9Q1QJM5_9CARY|nr:hypothetical protein Cgig2_026547 [Carnegiea gigantea]